MYCTGTIFSVSYDIDLFFFVLFADICRVGCSVGHICRGYHIHLHTSSEIVTQCMVGCVSFCRRSLASRQHCLSLLQGSIHKSWSCA